MRTKLEQYIDQMKQTCSTVLLDYKEAKRLIRDYESEEKYLTTYDAKAVFSIDQIQQKIPNHDAPKFLQSKDTDYFVAKINEAFIQFIIFELNLKFSQIQNRYDRELNPAFEADYLDFLSETFNRREEFDNDYVDAISSEEELSVSVNPEFDDKDSVDSNSSGEEHRGPEPHEFNDNYDYDSSSIEEEHHAPGSHDDIHDVCLRFLASIACNKYHPLHAGILSATQYSSSSELILAITVACREHLSQEKASITPFSSYFETPQMLVWGMDQGPGDTLDLSDHEVTFVFDEDRWQALAATYILTKKSTLILSSIGLSSLQLDTIGRAFSKAGASVHQLVLHNFSYLLSVNTDVRELGEFLRRMNVKTLDLSYNYLEMQFDAECLKTFGTMLRIGNVKKINLRGNDLFKMPESLWRSLCDCLANTEIESVEIDSISSHNLAMLHSVLKKPSTDPNSFFHHGKKTDLLGPAEHHYWSRTIFGHVS
ncbi:hypothetical protein [Legionella maioricensis]|uniref:Uncharacterized protein n=1 Tax=Legionella maioricensis TaxID=2896528 RepID=A0A9X2D3I2_9GAMM|nr:hypothetical protein [Legionella maioricensis]MCL9685694.1 hypothetical protein [Legionella maioricensis]MCL9689084.1 hypothetical protein [Legionella maioricensis]